MKFDLREELHKTRMTISKVRADQFAGKKWTKKPKPKALVA